MSNKKSRQDEKRMPEGNNVLYPWSMTILVCLWALAGLAWCTKHKCLAQNNSYTKFSIVQDVLANKRDPSSPQTF